MSSSLKQSLFTMQLLHINGMNLGLLAILQ